MNFESLQNFQLSRSFYLISEVRLQSVVWLFRRDSLEDFHISDEIEWSDKKWWILHPKFCCSRVWNVYSRTFSLFCCFFLSFWCWRFIPSPWIKGPKGSNAKSKCRFIYFSKTKCHKSFLFPVFLCMTCNTPVIQIIKLSCTFVNDVNQFVAE